MLEKKRKQFIKRYAKNFLRKIKEEWPMLGDVEMPEITFNRRIELISEEGEEVVGATFDEGRKVSIYRFARHKPEILRLIIRHEMIHAALWQTGLPCGDKDILFMAIAGCYNANPRFPHRVKVPEDVKNVEEWFFNHLASLNK